MLLARKNFDCLATCPKGLEPLLACELSEIGAEGIKQTSGGVHFNCSQKVLYLSCLWSRFGNRILLSLGSFKFDSVEQMYHHCGQVRWEEHFSANKTISVNFSGKSSLIKHSVYGAQVVKDAVVDRFRRLNGERPTIDLKQPDISIQGRLHRGRINLMLDMSGESLHRRGYRKGKGSAPLKENVAAALLMRAGWPSIATGSGSLVDPMCGSATFLIEAAMMSADIAPGLLRQRFGFHEWACHDEAIWKEILSHAVIRKQNGLKCLGSEIRGYDSDSRVLELARLNIEAIGLQDYLSLDLKQLEHFGKVPDSNGLVITNPPYGVRVGQIDKLRKLYKRLGVVLQKQFSGWRAAVFTGNVDLAREIDLNPSRQYKFYNGPIPCKLLLFDDMRSKSEKIRERLETPVPKKILSNGSQMLANRLAKNHRRMAPWLKRTGITCYRLYDADLPEYSAAIDIYGDFIHIQEYAPPASISKSVAQKHFAELKDAVSSFAPGSASRTFCKERRKQRGKNQYKRMANSDQGTVIVKEGRARFEVNLSKYLDTGLFLDHRLLRDLIAYQVKGKRFLNLFCYTASVTVRAALEGASSSLSCDMSNTYIDWARRNFSLNGVDTIKHQLLRVDCIKWLKSQSTASGLFDVILLDSPTFSNSKKMCAPLDIQRDHEALLMYALKLLAPLGTLYFSNNFRRFKMSFSESQRFSVQNISSETIDLDFRRNPRIHNVWKIQHSEHIDR